MSGTFQLTFNGETTPQINAVATAEELRSALETLRKITTAVVSRDYAVTAIGADTGAYDLDITFGSQRALCAHGEGASLLSPDANLLDRWITEYRCPPLGSRK